MLPRSSFARYALVAALASLVALALAAPAATAHNDGFNERIVNCVDTRDANSDQCRAALEVSPVDSNFFRVLADNLDNMPAKEEPKPEVDLYALVKECAATQDFESEECVVALEQSGLSVDEFKANFAAAKTKAHLLPLRPGPSNDGSGRALSCPLEPNGAAWCMTLRCASRAASAHTCPRSSRASVSTLFCLW